MPVEVTTARDLAPRGNTSRNGSGTVNCRELSAVVIPVGAKPITKANTFWNRSWIVPVSNWQASYQLVGKFYQGPDHPDSELVL